MFILFVHSFKFSKPKSETITPIVASTVHELSLLINDNFHDFLYTPITFKKFPQRTLLQLIESIGPLGAACLNEMNINVLNNKTNIQITKPDISKLKKSILQQFSQATHSYLTELDQIEELKECVTCHLSTDSFDFGYGILINKDHVPFLLDHFNAPKPTLGYKICSHLIHATYFRNVCPICRYQKTNSIKYAINLHPIKHNHSHIHLLKRKPTENAIKLSPAAVIHKNQHLNATSMKNF
jgi:hypothetical protein